jgi:hypothetical protein
MWNFLTFTVNRNSPEGLIRESSTRKTSSQGNFVSGSTASSMQTSEFHSSAHVRIQQVNGSSFGLRFSYICWGSSSFSSVYLKKNTVFQYTLTNRHHEIVTENYWILFRTKIGIPVNKPTLLNCGSLHNIWHNLKNILNKQWNYHDCFLLHSYPFIVYIHRAVQRCTSRVWYNSGLPQIGT